jgi:hypothetical protein
VSARDCFAMRIIEGTMLDGQQQRQCAACRAFNFADSCTDRTLADAVRIFAPEHTCERTAQGTPRGTQGSTDDARDELRELKAIDLVAFNRSAEERFCDYLQSLLRYEDALSVLDAIRECAFELDISPETAKRYLLKHTARRAAFIIADGKVRLRTPTPT